MAICTVVTAQGRRIYRWDTTGPFWSPSFCPLSRSAIALQPEPQCSLAAGRFIYDD